MSQGVVKPGTFPRPHLMLIGVLTLLMMAFAVEQFSHNEADRFSSEAVLVDLPPLGESARLPVLPSAGSSTEAAVGEETATGPTDFGESARSTRTDATTTHLTVTDNPPNPLPDSAAVTAVTLTTGGEPLSQPTHRIETVQVNPGDNLSLIFKRQDLPARELHQLLESEPLGKRLKSIFPGHTLTFTRTDDGTLLKLAYTPGPLETLEFERVGEGFTGREMFQEPSRSRAYKHGIIDHSLFVASQRAGLPDNLTMRLAQIFQWDIDFVLDIRREDEFHVVFEELYVGEKFVGHGDILAAEFINRGKSYRAIRYTDSDGHSDYYTPAGDSLRKAFLRAPVEFSRISSNFNLRRIHPLFKRNMPHRGIDYAAPTGTPILAAGDGRVITASRTQPNGNFVVIQHGEQFTTKYLHLSRFAKGIKAGARVKQGQMIGYVGSTGWASGPHLHYEFLVNGVHQNPRTVPLPDAQPIPAQERLRFNERTEPLLSLLDDFKQQVQLALGR